MTCERPISAAGSAEASGPGLSSDGHLCTPLISTHGAPIGLQHSGTPDGGTPGLESNAPTSPDGCRPLWMENWICSQRDSLARIFQPPEKAKGLEEKAPAPPTPDACEQLTLGGLDESFSRTPRQSGRKAAPKSPPTWWREDTAGETESLARLMLGLRINGIGGISWPKGPTLVSFDANESDSDPEAWARRRERMIVRHGAKGKMGMPLRVFLPTLTASEMNGGRHLPPGTTFTGIRPDGKKTQVGLKNALRMLPTLTAMDFRTSGTLEGYRMSREKRSKPLNDTLVHEHGIRLTPTFAEWWMGWPLGSTVAVESPPSVTPGCPSKPLRRTKSSRAKP